MTAKTKKAGKIAAYIIVALLLIGAVGTAFVLTNGFTERFKSFYLSLDGEQLPAGETERDFKRNTAYRFDVKYIFSKGKQKTGDYSVKVETNADKDFTFTVKGRNYGYRSGADITSAFDIDKRADYFIFGVREDACLDEVLKTMYPDAEIAALDATGLSDSYLYRLTVTSYDGKVTYGIKFRLRTQVTGVEFESKELLF